MATAQQTEIKKQEPVIFDSVRHPRLRVAMPGEALGDTGKFIARNKRITFAAGVYRTDNPEEIEILSKKARVYREDGLGVQSCPICQGQLHSVAALKDHMASHVQR